jgi:hypothetical protein
MKKGQKFKRTKIYLVAVSAILIAGLLIFIGRGWIRGSLIPSIYSSTHKPRIEALLDTEFSNIKPAFETLGIRNFYKVNEPECLRSSYEKFEIYMPCHSSSLGGRGSLSRESFKQKLKEASPIFLKSGWQYTDSFKLNEVNNSDKWIDGSICYFDLDTPTYDNNVAVHIDMRCEHGKSRYD